MTPMLVAIRSVDGERVPKMMKWGLLPHWAKDDKLACSTFNARSEEFTTKPALRDAWKRGQRCLVEAAQTRLDQNPQAMRVRRETVEQPFGTLKMRMGATHFLMRRLPKVATEMALHVLAYNVTRVMNIVGIQPLMAAIRT